MKLLAAKQKEIIGDAITVPETSTYEVQLSIDAHNAESGELLKNGFQVFVAIGDSVVEIPLKKHPRIPRLYSETINLAANDVLYPLLVSEVETRYYLSFFCLAEDF